MKYVVAALPLLLLWRPVRDFIGDHIEHTLFGRVESRSANAPNTLRLFFSPANYLYLLTAISVYVLALVWVGVLFINDTTSLIGTLKLYVELSVFASLLMAPRVFGLMKWEEMEVPYAMDETLLALIWFIQVLVYGYLFLNLYHYLFGIEVMEGAPKHMFLSPMVW